MKSVLRFVVAILAVVPMCALAQNMPARDGGPPTKTTFVRLGGRGNGVIVERVTPDPVKSKIAVLVTHPEHANNFNYFHGLELAKYGYTILLVNN